MSITRALPRSGIIGKRFLSNAKATNICIADERYESKGAWVYRSGAEWDFERFDTIDKAVRYATKLKDGAVVICRGREIKFNMLDKERAFFIDFDGKARLVEL